MGEQIIDRNLHDADFPLIASMSYVYSGDNIIRIVRFFQNGSETKNLAYDGTNISTIGSWY
jgi:hypothetical protein